jgi:hypothetical protein
MENQEFAPMSDDTLKPSPFGYDYGGETFTVAKASRRLAEAGFPSDLMAMSLRRFNKHGLVHTSSRKGEGKLAAHLFGLHDLVVAKILQELTDIGIADLTTLQAASLAFYSWQDDRPARFAMPVVEAMIDVSEGKWPTFTLSIWRHSQTGERRVVGEVRTDLLTGPQERDFVSVEQQMGESGWRIRSSIVLELPPLIMLVLTPREKTN